MLHTFYHCINYSYKTYGANKNDKTIFQHKIIQFRYETHMTQNNFNDRM